MNTLRPFIITAAVLFLPMIGRAITCPELPADGDWDRDGISNGADACCYLVTLPEDNLEANCPEIPDGPSDLNQNGRLYDDEESCCINTAGSCHIADPQDECDDDEIPISCDRLLFYSGMDTHATTTDCGDECICYAVDDFDDDARSNSTTPFAFDLTDNCPSVEAPIDLVFDAQSNRDDDPFGDLCDLCLDVDDTPPRTCEMADVNSELACPEATPCLPFVSISPDRATVSIAYYCAPNREIDNDGDFIGNSCDNCIDTINPLQTDIDRDGTGDACDLCKDDPEKTEPGQCGCGVEDGDEDGDGVADCIDNCPKDGEKSEPGQCGCGFSDADEDGDGVANCNDECPKDGQKTTPGNCGCQKQESNSDRDNDGVLDCIDNCPDHKNPDQLDDNLNDVGDICEGTDTESDGPSDPIEDTESDIEDTESFGDTESEEWVTDSDTESEETDSEDSDPWDADGGDASAGEDTDDTESSTADTETGSGSETEDSETEDKGSETEDSESKPTDIEDTESESGPIDTAPDTQTSEVEDTESDRIAPPDKDSDGIPDSIDNCPFTANPDQNDGACTEDVFKGGACVCDTTAVQRHGLFSFVIILLNIQ